MAEQLQLGSPKRSFRIADLRPQNLIRLHHAPTFKLPTENK